MARNAGGTYSLPLGPVVTGTTILSTWANTTLNDLAPELTDSLSRSGKGGMQAPLGLQDGTLGGPGLAFNLELSTGLRRAAAGDLRLVVAGVDRLALTTNAVFTSGLVAADAGVDFTVNSQNTRTNGSLFDVSNNSTVRLRVRPDGAIALSGAVITSDLVTNLGLTLKGNKNAADTGTDLILTSIATRTSGLLLDVQNNGASKLSLSPTGMLTAGDLTAATLTALSGGFLALKSNLTGASASTDFLLRPINSRTAGLLFDVQNNNGALSAFNVGPTGNVTIGTAASIVLTTDNVAGSTNTDFSFSTVNVRTAGNLFALASGATKAKIDFEGRLTAGLGFYSSAGTEPIRVNIVSDVTNSSSTVATNLGPSLAVKSGKTYRIHGRFRSWSSVVTTGFGIGIKSTGAPTTTLIAISHQHWGSAGALLTNNVTNVFSDTPSTYADAFTTTAGVWDTFDAVVTTSSTGTIQLLLITEVNASTVTVGAGSWFEITED